MNATLRVFGDFAKPETIRHWMKPSLVHKWMSSVAELTLRSILSVVEDKFKQKLPSIQDRSMTKVSESILNQFSSKKTLQPATSYENVLTTLQSTKHFSTQKMLGIAKTDKAIQVIRQTTKRVSCKESSEIVRRYERGDPITKLQVYAFMQQLETQNEDFKKLVSNTERARVFLCRGVLSRMHYSARCGSIGQAVPKNWNDIAVEDSARIRERMKNCDRIVAMDETFILFHPHKEKLLVPTGSKRVGAVIPVEDEKKGITLVVGCELYATRRLPPFIIDTGEFGAKLMEEWRSYKKSVVLFNSTHWMTQYIFILFLGYLKVLYKGKSIVVEWLNSEEGKDIVVDYIREGMTSVHQVGDITINKTLKSRIRCKYQDLRYKEAQDLKAGEVFRVPREKLIDIIEEVYDDINIDNERKRWIASGFELCGLHPEGDLSLFKQHLASLEQNKVYAAMMSSVKPLDLSIIDK
ncbi:hypothetical protein Ae201684P_006901 [Aphanomyces euteiches]|nr:hypothetical protein Ae201684P_006901 [Aphanomyces euteiches]